jgi:hypothetical protein
MQAIVRTAKGVFSQYNPLHEIQEGAVAEARNCSIYKEGIFGPRRGVDRYGIQFQPETLMEFDSTLLGLDGTTIKYDSDGLGTWVAWPSSWAPPESGVRMRHLQARTALYLLASTGVYYTEDIADEAIRAGLATGLDTETVSNDGGGSGWFLPDNQVGYRVVWGRLTPYGALHLGAPSMRKVAVNSWNVGLSWTASASTVTVTQTAHGYATNNYIVAANLSDADAAPSTGQITVTGVDTYTYTCTGTPGASGTGDFARNEYVLVRFSCPDDLQYGDFYEIYRTELSGADTTDPGDEQKRIARVIVNDNAVTAVAVSMTGSATTVTVTLTAHGFAKGDVVLMSEVSVGGYENGAHEITSVTANTFTYEVASAPGSGTGKCRLLTTTHIDGLDPSFLADKLYTNPTQETITQANTRPPWAKTFCQWKNRIWYGNTKREHYLDIQLTGVTGLVAGTSSLTLTLGASTETYTFATAVDYYAKEFLLDSTSTTEAEKIRRTMQSLCTVINRCSEYWYAWYTSGIEDAPGMVTIETRALNTAEFSMTCNATATGTVFEPDIPTSGTNLYSDNFRLLNGVYYSKPNQPHAAPDGNFNEDLGDPSREVLRLIPTRDSILVVKEDGIFRISGDSDRTFTFRALDTTVFARAPETWVGLDNAVWGLSTKGVLRVTESGTELMSKPNEPDIEALLDHASFETLCHAVGYESEGLYILFAPELSTDAKCTIGWVYPADGSAGPTTWHRDIKAAHVLFDDQELFVVSGDSDDHVFRERKNHDDLDYMDEELDLTVQSVTTYEHADLGTRSRVRVLFPIAGTLNTDMVPKAGDLFRYTPLTLPYSKILTAENVDVDTYDFYLADYFPGMIAGAGTVTRSIPCVVKWHPEAAGAATVLKSFSFLQLYFNRANVSRATVAFNSDLASESEYEILLQALQDNALRVVVPQSHALGRTLQVTFKHQVANEPWELIERSLEFYKTSLATGVLPR